MMKLYSVFTFLVGLCFIWKQSIAQNKVALMSQRQALMVQLDQLNNEYQKCDKVCKLDKENGEKAYGKEYLHSDAGAEKAAQIESIYNTCHEQCYARFRAKYVPLQDEIIVNTNKIQAAGGIDVTAPAPASTDPDLGGKGIVFSPVSEPKKKTSKENKEAECRRLIDFRDRGMYHLYQSTLTQFQINQEAKQDFLKYAEELTSDSKYFDTKAEGAYYLAQITKTTSNLIRNTLEIANKSFRPLNDAVDKLMASQVEGDDKIGVFQEVVFDKTCSLLVKDKGILGSSSKAACTLVNDIKRLSTIKTGVETTRALLKSQLTMLKLQLEVYEQNLEKEKKNVANLNDIQALLNDYLAKNCSK